jgi:hypothetical protein
LKISVVIPCDSKHLHNMQYVFDMMLKSTRIPDEVVVRFSSMGSVPIKASSAVIQEGQRLFKEFKYACLNTPEYSGPNRQVASEMATGDLIIYQDADDLPHYRRFELIDKYFEQTGCMHLNHAYYHNTEWHTQPVFDDSIKMVESGVLFNRYFPDGDISKCWAHSYGYDLGFSYPLIHTGATSIRRDVLEKVKWKHPNELYLAGSDVVKERTEDYEFCMEILHSFNKSILIDAPLYFYYK